MTLRELIIKLGADTTDYDRKFVKSTKQLQDFGAEAEKVGQRLALSISLPIAGIGLAALKTAGEMEQTKVAFTTLLKSADAAGAHIASLKKFALETPFQFDDLTKASRLMQAFGTSAIDVVPRLRTLGNAVSALGGGSDVLERVVRSMGEIGTRGKITGEQLREVSRAGIPALDAIAQKLGVSVKEAQDKITAGMVDARTATDALLEYMDKRFAGGMEAQSKTLLGMMSNLKDKLTFTMAEVGNALIPLAKDVITNYIDPLLGKVKDMAEGFAKLPKPVQEATIGVAAFAALLPPMIWATGTLITNASVIAGAFAKMGGASSLVAVALNPLTIILGTLVALIPRVLDFWKKLRVEWENDEFLSTLRGHFVSMDKAMADNLERLRPLAPALHVTKVAVSDFNDRLRDAEKTLGLNIKGNEDLSKAVYTVYQAYRAGVVSLNVYTLALEKYGATIEKINKNRPEAYAFPNPTQSAVTYVPPPIVDMVTLTTGATALERFSQLLTSIKLAWNPLATAGTKALEAINEAMVDSLSGTQEMLDDINRSDAFEFFGIKSAAALKKLADEAKIWYDVILNDTRSTTTEIEQAWIKMTEIESEAAHVAGGENADEIYRVNKIMLDAMKKQTDGSHEAVVKQARDRYNLSAEVIQASHRMFDGLERDLARNIVQWKGWRDTLKSLWQNLAQDLLQIMLKVALKPLEDAIVKLLGKLPGVGQAGGGVLGTTVGAAGGAAGTIGGAAKGVGGAVSGIAGGISSGLTGILTAAFTGITALFSGIGMFQNMHMETSLNAIEHNTRYSMMYLGERSDGGILGTLFKINEEIAWGSNTKATEALKDAFISWANGGGKAGGGSVTIDLRGSTFGGVTSQASVEAMMAKAYELAIAARG